MQFVQLLLFVAMSGIVVGDFLRSGKAHVSPPISRFAENGCDVYCNGSPVVSNVNSCVGALNSFCLVDNMSFDITCLGTYDLIITPELEANVTCQGLYFLNVKGVSSEGLDFEVGDDCGGTASSQYSVTSPDNIIPISPINTTCDGTHIMVAVQNRTRTPTNDPTCTPNIKKSIGNVARGISNIEVVPQGYNCTRTCDGEEYDGMVCNGDMEMTCDVKQDGVSSIVVYGCQGLFVGEWGNMACTGYGELVVTNEYFVQTLVCTKQTGFKLNVDESKEIKQFICDGGYSMKTAMIPAHQKSSTVV